MQRPLISERLIPILLACALLLPVAICVVLGVGSLLKAMGDLCGGAVLGRIALAGGILWFLDLVGLLLVLAIHSLRVPDEPE